MVAGLQASICSVTRAVFSPLIPFPPFPLPLCHHLHLVKPFPLPCGATWGWEFIVILSHLVWREVLEVWERVAERFRVEKIVGTNAHDTQAGSMEHAKA